MFTEETYNKTILSIYSAFQGSIPFEEMLKDVAHLMGAQQSAILCVDAETGSGFSRHSFGYDPEMWKLYNERYNKIDPRLPAVTRIRPLNTVTAQAAAPNAEIRDSQYFNEISVPFDSNDVLFGSFGQDEEDGQLGITVSRGFSQEFFSSDDEKLFRNLLPHIQNAQAGAKAARDTLLLQQIGALPEGSITLLVSEAMHIEPVSENWRIIVDKISSGDEPFGRIDFTSDGQRTQLQHLVSEAVHSRKSRAFQFSGPEGDHYIGRLAPLGHKSNYLRPTPVSWAILNITPTRARNAWDFEKFGTQYGLTERELDVMVVFAETFNLRESAEVLGLAYQTARWHFRNILDKTMSRNQAELIHKLAMSYIK